MVDVHWWVGTITWLQKWCSNGTSHTSGCTALRQKLLLLICVTVYSRCLVLYMLIHGINLSESLCITALSLCLTEISLRITEASLLIMRIKMYLWNDSFVVPFTEFFRNKVSTGTKWGRQDKPCWVEISNVCSRMENCANTRIVECVSAINAHTFDFVTARDTTCVYLWLSSNLASHGTGALMVTIVLVTIGYTTVPDAGVW